MILSYQNIVKLVYAKLHSEDLLTLNDIQIKSELKILKCTQEKFV